MYLQKGTQFVDIPLEEEDSSDEEYHPDEEEEDETAEEVQESIFSEFLMLNICSSSVHVL